MKQLIFILVFVIPVQLFAQHQENNPILIDSVNTTNKSLVLNYSFIDLPFAIRAGKTVNTTFNSNPSNTVSLFKGLQYFSMKQSVQIPSNVINLTAYGVTKIPIFKKRPVLKKISDNLISFIASTSLSYAPFGSAWTHEEYHRAVMAASYTNSYNPFTFNKKNVILGNAVSSVLDENLVLMKETYNPNFVRMSTAGIEGPTLMVESLQRQNFFYNSKLPISLTSIFELLDVQSYIALCSNKEVLTKASMETIEIERENQEQRDFTGLDLAAWAYDLFNPDLPYSARGLHKYGNGYDRYIYGDKLTDEQYDWLKKQAKLSYLNFISPSIFFMPSVTLKTYEDGTKLRGSFSFRHYPTSFGNTIGLDLMYSNKEFNILITPHLNQNYKHSFLGLEMLLFEYPIKIGKEQFYMTPRVITEIQPKDQRFMTTKGQFTGLAEIDVVWKANKNIYPYISMGAKTSGWVKGNAFLDKKFILNFGVSARFN